ncbi:TIR-like protein FxsC [Saccharothrix sp. ST-888]|uniref:TIR-like protein FxsC n=1 Tax=Saccharothrix sp. ST-888 TaxID=1427391 RepID=UPI000AFC6FF2|nr:TIR-like protein FxsC [Saccharothrix sp. ST-888]
MSSDQPPGPAVPAPGPLDQLAALLADLGLADPGPVELAELLWLAARSGEGGAEQEPGHGSAGNSARRNDRRPADPNRTGGRSAGTATGEGQSVRTALHLASGDPEDTVAAVAAIPTPSVPMLARPLALQRALRPLKRRVPDPRHVRLDETATAERLAEAVTAKRTAGPPSGPGHPYRPGPVPWLPVLRPATERWLDLHLIFDCGPTMALWRPLLQELRTLLVQTGAFRQVVQSCLDPSGRPASRPTPDARTVVLVLSDCMGPQWRPGAAGSHWYRTLHRLAHRSPVAVVQPLPERLWPLAALPPEVGLLSAPEAGVPNSAYRFAPFGELLPGRGELPVPVLEPGAGWIANWARLVGSPTGGQVVGSALLVGAEPMDCAPDAEPLPEPHELGPEELVLRFRSVASREAFTLAGLTALTTPALPVMRLLQRASFTRPQPQHLAEVVVSGLLKEREGRRDHFEFRSGVRELLLHTLPRSTTHQAVGLLARVGEQIADRAGRVPGEFAALAATDTGGAVVPVERRAFALISPAALRLLDGPPAPVLQQIPQPDRQPVPVPQTPPSLPDPERSRAVLLLTTSRASMAEPLADHDFRAYSDLNNLAAALSSRALVGLAAEHVWVGLDDPAGFQRALRAAAAEAEDALVVYVGGAVVHPAAEGLALGSPAREPAQDWAGVLAALSAGRARNRLLVFDGWQDEPGPPAEGDETDSGIHTVISIRPRTGPSFAAGLNQVLREGQPGGAAELELAGILERTLGHDPDDPSWSLAFSRNARRPFLFSRNPAVTGVSPSLRSSQGVQTSRRLNVPSHSRTQRQEPEPQGPVQPYFFLSYPVTARPQPLVDQLFADLTEEVMQLTTLPGGVPAGFMDRLDPADPEAAQRVSEALAGCRVLVPLYSRRYFRSERCGREWTAFERRGRLTGWSSGIVPVLWSPVPLSELPPVAARLQYVESGLGASYTEEGLYGLASLRKYRQQYEMAVHRIAWRIVDVAERIGIPPGPPLQLDSLANAFAPESD